MLTSPRNPKIQWVRSLQAQAKARREAGLFVVEGVRLVEEALTAGTTPELILYTAELGARGALLVDAFRKQDAAVEQVSQQVMKAASDTDNPQGILAVLPIRPVPIPEEPDFVLVLDALRDPGNLGTILRTAAAAGTQAVLLSPETVDPYAPKVVRAAMGAHFHMPVQALSWHELADYLHSSPGSSPLNVYLADSEGGQEYTQADFLAPTALIIGGEAEGAGEEARSLAGARLHIPMPGRAESLNAAVSAAVLLFEVVRQRGLPLRNTREE